MSIHTCHREPDVRQDLVLHETAAEKAPPTTAGRGHHRRRFRDTILAASATAFLALLMAAPASASGVSKCKGDTASMLDRGLNAYVAHDYAAARTEFECMIARPDDDNRLYALFYLARIFADNNGSDTDHARAYQLYNTISQRYSEPTDPDDPRRGPFVARALTAVGIYVLQGIPDAGIRPDPARAAEIFRYAATFFDEPQAQFELAKLALVGEGGPADPKFALHYLQKLSKRGHSGAQAFLADLLARGKYVKQDKITALALSRLAAKHAQPSDRLWVEDIHQHIFCGAPQGVRAEANGLVAKWSREYRPPSRQGNARNPNPDLQPELRLTPDRTCSNGETVEASRSGVAQGPALAGMTDPAAKPGTPADQQSVGVQSFSPRDR